MILNSPYITGSLTVTGNITASGGITISGSIDSASYAANAGLLSGLASGSFVSTSSFTTVSGSFSSRVSTIEGSYATTGSNVFVGNQTVCANITSTGVITAQRINVQQVTSSIVYSSGSNIFGCLPSDVQQMTGSLRVTGSGNHWFQTGNVGIGTTTPSYPLHIQAASPRIWMVDSTANGSCFEVAADTTSVGIYNRSNLPLTIGTNNTERMRITSAGNVAIGITVPSASLHVNCTVEANGSLYRAIFGGAVQNANMTGISGGNGSEVQIQAGSSTRGAFLTLGGGMGASEAMGGVAFYNSNNTDGKRLRAYLVGGQEGATANEQGGYLTFGTAANAATTPTERMRIDSSGNVGIGYTPCCSYAPLQVKTPPSTYTIDVIGRTAGLNGESQITFWNSAQTVVQGAIGNVARCMIFYAGGTEVMRMTCGGNVGIGTCTPSQKLEVVGGEIKAGRIDSTNEGGQVSFGRASDNATGWYIDVYGNTSTPSLRFVDVSNSAVRMTLDGSGNTTLGGGIAGGAVYALSGYVNETQTISTPAVVYYLNKDQGNAGGSSSTTFNITGIPNVDGAFALLYLRSSNTTAGINVGITVQVHGNTIFSTSTQNVTKTASFYVFKANGNWFTSAVGTGSTAGYP